MEYQRYISNPNDKSFQIQVYSLPVKKDYLKGQRFHHDMKMDQLLLQEYSQTLPFFRTILTLFLFEPVESLH